MYPNIDGIMASLQLIICIHLLQTNQTVSNRLDLDHIVQQDTESLRIIKHNESNKEKWDGQNKEANTGYGSGQTIMPTLSATRCINENVYWEECNLSMQQSMIYYFKLQRSPSKKDSEQCKEGTALVFTLKLRIKQ